MNTPTPIIAANWKMHKTSADIQPFFNAFADFTLPENAQVIIAPSATLLHSVQEHAGKLGIAVAAQNMHQEAEGAFTGELSAAQVIDTGATHVIIGHSERRHVFGETPEQLRAKVNAAIAAGLTPIYCVGETEAERDAGNASDVVNAQVREGLADCDQEQRASVIVAYEPVWAIGTGKTATPELAQEMHAVIREQLPDNALLYGGSVKPGNAADLFAQPDINGVLVGGASLEPESFIDIIRASQ